MYRPISLSAGLLTAVALSSGASAQLTSRERERAQEIARIQAKADAEEQAKGRKIRREMAQANCRSSMRVWDYVNEVCLSRRVGAPRTPQ